MATSPLATPTATRAVLVAHGLFTKKRLGQHFLVDDNIVARILALADLDPGETVLEVGPGIGTLTLALCQTAGAVVAVEQDAELIPVLAETGASCSRLAVLNADAVSIGMDVVSKPFGSPSALVANLPYSVAATVVLRFFEFLPSLAFAVVMVQAEVADRMAAVPGTKDYGAYSVKLQLIARPITRFFVSRSCFMPPPRVDSAVIRLERRDDALGEERRADAFAAADAAFAQRRKTIRNSLRSTLGVPAEQLDGALEIAGIDGDMRAETLEPSAFLTLGEQLRNAGCLD